MIFRRCKRRTFRLTIIGCLGALQQVRLDIPVEFDEDGHIVISQSAEINPMKPLTVDTIEVRVRDEFPDGPTDIQVIKGLGLT